MNPCPPTKEIVSVAEMARMLGLSRSRFYQLVKQGIFPSPARKPETTRPFYDRQGQEECLRIRSTNCGANGQPILFYARHIPLPSPITTSRPSAGKKPSPTIAQHQAPDLTWLRSGLQQLGVEAVTDEKLRAAVAACYPSGVGTAGQEEILVEVFRHLKCQN